jgi:nucleotide-binding universal stress UspA family protein
MTTQDTFPSSWLAEPNAIVVATDLVDLSDLLPHAIAQAKASDAALHIVHAIPSNKVFVPESGMVPSVDPIKMAQDTRNLMEELISQIGAQGLRYTTEVRPGDPADVVTDVTRETGAQRVIVSTHGRTGIKRMVLGSVASKILAKSKVPVCTIGPNCQRPSDTGVKRILHPTSLGPDAEASAKLALDLAQHYRAELTLLHVITPDSAIEPYLDPQYAFENLEFLLPQSSSDFYAMVHKRVVQGDKKEQILREAEAIRADFIVLGSHSASGSGRSAYSVVVSATCPVLSFNTPVQLEQSVREQSVQEKSVQENIADSVFASMRVDN